MGIQIIYGGCSACKLLLNTIGMCKKGPDARTSRKYALECFFGTKEFRIGFGVNDEYTFLIIIFLNEQYKITNSLITFLVPQTKMLSLRITTKTYTHFESSNVC